jgi:hypothetical protein
MRIQVREFASVKNPLRYLVTVDKPGGLQSEYVVEFKGGTVLVPYLESYYTEAELSENTLMVDFLIFRLSIQSVAFRNLNSTPTCITTQKNLKDFL